MTSFVDLSHPLEPRMPTCLGLGPARFGAFVDQPSELGVLPDTGFRSFAEIDT